MGWGSFTVLLGFEDIGNKLLMSNNAGASKDPVLRKELGENARRAAEQKYNREYIARDFVSYLEQLRS